MKPKIGSLTFAILLVFLSQSESFFFPQFLRRQTNGPSTPIARGSPSPGRRQESAGFQGLKRPRSATNTLTDGPNPNFEVPSSLCLACGNFPWTPVAGKEHLSSGSVSSASTVTATAETAASSSKQRPDYHDFPVHQHLQVTKEPGNTVVINALSPDVQEGTRKPFSFAFGSSGNSVNGPSSSQSPSPDRPPTFGGPIVIPYEQGKNSKSPADAPRQPAASSLNPGYAQPPPVPAPGLYGSHTPPLTSTHQTFSKVLPPTHPQNLGPITVGTILAAQQTNNYQIQPAKLVYQEHSSVRQPSPSIFVPLPPRPQTLMQPPAPSPSVPQSFKVPILSNSNPSPSGTVALNQIPVNVIPNYAPSYASNYAPSYAPNFVPNYNPSFVTQGLYAFPVPAPAPPPAVQYYEPFTSQRQPKPGYGSALLGSHDTNRFRVPEQQLTEESKYSEPAGSQGHAVTIDELRPLLQRPSPPARPYTPSQFAPSTASTASYSREKAQTVAPTPTYIPPRVTGHQYTTLTDAKETGVQTTNDLGEESKANIDDNGYPALEFMPSQTNQVKIPPEQTRPVKDDVDFYRHKPITIPNLLRIQQAYRFLDEDPGTTQFIPHQAQRSQIPTRDNINDVAVRPTISAPKPTVSTAEPVPKPVAVAAPKPSPVPAPRPSPVPDLNLDTKTGGGNKYGSYEFVPAAQYDITHLFRNENKKSSEPASSGPKPFPVPVPVPISEAEVANSKSPLFVIDPLGNNNQDTDGQYHGPSYEDKQHAFSNFHRQMYHDPLPPAVYSALQHAQTTSFLTHQHLGDHRQRQNTIYLNSIPVPESNPPVPQPVPVHQKRILKPIAFDLNSGKEITLQSSRAEMFSLQTVPDTEGEPDQRKIIPAFTLQEGSNLNRHHVPTENQRSPDQNTINCQNNQEWAAGPSRPGSETEYGAGVEEEGGNGQKPFVFYYPAQGGSYWIPQPIQDKELVYGHQVEQMVEVPPPTTQEYQVEKVYPTTATVQAYQVEQVASPATTGQTHQVEQRLKVSPPTTGVDSHQVEQMVKVVPPTTTTHVPNPILDRKESAIRTYLAKPILKWSKVVKPKVKTEEISTVSTTQKQNREGIEVSTEPVDHHETVDSSIKPEQILDSDYKVESESKEVEATPRSSSYRLVDEKVGYETIATGHTTAVECVTEPTTTTVTDGIYVATTVTTPKPPVTSVLPTFSPRIHSRGPEDKKNRGTRFPAGRPTVSALRPTEESSSVAAAFVVPIYRPTQVTSSTLQPEITKVTEQILSKSDDDDSSENLSKSTVALPLPSNTFTPSFSSVEDDEADDLQTKNSLGEVATGRKISSSFLPLVNNAIEVPENKTTTATTVIFSSPIGPTMETGPMKSTKVVKTVRVRQRMRPNHFTQLTTPQRLKMTGASRVRVMTRTGATDYVRSNQGGTEILGEDEQKEVKEAEIDIKKVSNT